MDGKDEKPPAKKVKTDAVGEGEKPKNVNPLGSMIGRKRKERKGKK